MQKISKHCSLHEAIQSQTATRRKIDNTPTEQHLKNMNLVAERCFEPIRTHFGVPLFISSFYRSKRLNQAIGGSKTSDHQYGLAIDIDADVFGGVTNAEIYEWAKVNLEYDQLIWEFGTEENPAWVHISYRSPSQNRNQAFKI